MYGEGLSVRSDRYASMAGMSVRTCILRESTPCRRLPLTICSFTAFTPHRYVSRSSSRGSGSTAQSVRAGAMKLKSRSLILRSVSSRARAISISFSR